MTMTITIDDIDVDKLVQLKQQQKMHYATVASSALDVNNAKIDLDNAVKNLRTLEVRAAQNAHSRKPEPAGFFDAKLKLARVNESSARQSWQAMQEARAEHGRKSGVLNSLLQNVAESLKKKIYSSTCWMITYEKR